MSDFTYGYFSSIQEVNFNKNIPLNTPPRIISLSVKARNDVVCWQTCYNLIVARSRNMLRTILKNMFTKSIGYTRTIANEQFDIEVNRMVWIDMEMSGLDVEKDKIMEVACIVTDSQLNIIAEGPNIILHQPPEVLNNMDEWCTKQHGKTGLTEASSNSNTSLLQAEDALLDFLSEYVTEKASPIAGNSVYMDRIFLRRHMPRLNDYLHYRILDVSTIKELCKRWNNDLYKKVPKKEFSHRALADIKESIEELKFYKENFFETSDAFGQRATVKE